MQLGRLSRALGEDHVVGCQGNGTDRVVKSASRVLTILELFDILRRDALVSEVSDLLGYPQSSTSVLLRSMVVMGYLHFNPETRAFGPTTRVALLGSWINGSVVSNGKLNRLVERVNARTGQAVVLAVRNRVWSEYIHVAQATDALRLFVIKGSRRPLVRSGTGRALLSGLSDLEIQRIALRHNAESGDNVCISELLEQLAESRERGWVASYDTVTKGGGSIAMRLPQYDGEERMVMGVAGLTSVLRENTAEFVAAMQDEIAADMASSGLAPVATPALAS